MLLVVSSLTAGGAERVVSELADVWADKGWRVGVLTLTDSATDHYVLDPRAQRITLNVVWKSTSLWQTLTSNVRRSRMLRESVRAFAPDVVLSFVDQTNIRVLAALLYVPFPVVVSERVDPRHYPLGRTWNVARRLLYPMAAALVVQTYAVANWGETIVARNKVKVIPNFPRRQRIPSRTRQREKIVLGVGRLVKQKGFDVLLRAYAKSAAHASGHRLVILGEGCERAAISTLATELGIADRLELPGVVTEPEDWMERAAVFVLSSRFEGFPNALVEAMAMGCAVISTDCASGPREIVRHEHDGLLVPPEDPDALAAALSRLIDDKTLRERLETNAIAVRDRFSVPAVMGQWEALIHEVSR